MKNRLFYTTVFTVFSAMTSLSQNNKFGVGVEVGPNVNVYYGNEIAREYNQPGLGFSVGGSFQYNFPNLFSIRGKIAFERKLTKSDFTFTDQNGNELQDAEIENQTHYISIPIVGRVKLGQKFKFLGDFGGFVGVLMNNTLKYKNFDPPQEDYNNTGNVRRIDAGICLGVGTGYQITKNLLISLTARNNLSVVNNSKSNFSGNNFVALNTTNILIGVDYCFGSTE